MPQDPEELKARLAKAREARAAKAAQRATEFLPPKMTEEKDFDDLPVVESLDQPEGVEVAEAQSMVKGSAEIVPIYDTTDGTVSACRIEQADNRCLPRPGGKAMFSRKPVNKAWKYRTDEVTGLPAKIHENALMCLLHPDHPDRAWYDSIGLANRFCGGADSRPVSSLPNQFELRQHMSHKHRQEWAVIQDAEAERRRQEERREQLEMLRTLAGQRG